MLGDFLGDIDRDRADQHRLALLVLLVDFPDDRPVLGLLILVDDVGEILSDHLHMGGQHHHVEVVDLLEFRCLGIGGTSHAGQLVVHPEIVLEGDRGQRLVLPFDLHVFLGLQGLVQTVTVAPALHGAPGELVNDHHLTVLDDVIHITFEQDMSLERLIEVMQVFDIARVVEVFQLEQLLTKGNALLVQGDLAAFFVHQIMLVALELAHDPVDVLIQLRGNVGRT